MQSLELAREMTHVGQEAADEAVRRFGLLALGSTLLQTGALDEAVAHLQTAIQLCEAAPDYQGLPLARSDLGQCYLRQRKLADALAILEATHQLMVQHGLRGPLFAPVYNTIAEAYLVAVEQADDGERSVLLRKAEHACQTALKQGKHYRAELPGASRWQGTYEWLRGKPGHAEKWWQRSLAAAEELGMPYELGRTHLEMGQRLGDRAHLERAEAIFAAMGAKWDQAKAREILQRG